MPRIDTEQYITLIGEISIGSGSPTPINNQQKTVEPSIEQLVVRPDTGYTGLSRVTINAVTSSIDENIIASNIKSGVEILGVMGTYAPSGGYAPSYDNGTLIFDSSSSATVSESELVLWVK